MPNTAYPTDPFVRTDPVIPKALLHNLRLFPPRLENGTHAYRLHAAVQKCAQQGYLVAHPKGGVYLREEGTSLLAQWASLTALTDGTLAWTIGAADPNAPLPHQGAFLLGAPDDTGYRIHPSLFQHLVPRQHQPLPLIPGAQLMAALPDNPVFLQRHNAMPAQSLWPHWADHTTPHHNPAVDAGWELLGQHLWAGLQALAPDTVQGRRCRLTARARLTAQGTIAWQGWECLFFRRGHTQTDTPIKANIAATPALAPLWAYLSLFLRQPHPLASPAQTIPRFSGDQGYRVLWDERALPETAHTQLQARHLWNGIIAEPHTSIAAIHHIDNQHS